MEMLDLGMVALCNHVFFNPSKNREIEKDNGVQHTKNPACCNIQHLDGVVQGRTPATKFT